MSAATPQPEAPVPGVWWLWHLPHHAGAAAVRLALAERGLPWFAQRLDPLRAEHVTPVQPLGAPIGPEPVLLGPEGPATGTRAALEAVAATPAGPLLLPASAQHRARMGYWLDQWDALPLEPLAWSTLTGMAARMARARLKRERRMVQDAAAPPEVRDAALARVAALEAVVGRPAETEALVARVVPILDDMERHLAEHSWLAGPGLSLAEVAWAAALTRLERAGLQHLWAGGLRPHVEHYLGRCQKRPAFAEAYAEEPPPGRWPPQVWRVMRVGP